MPGKGKTVTKKAFVDPLKNRNIGRRTGIDIKAGKNIRKNEEGFEMFDDYWTESDDDSLYLSRTNRRSVNRNNHTLSNNRIKTQHPLHSMSPFIPSSVENSAPVSPRDHKEANRSGASLNYKGEVLGTITRLGSESNSQAAKGEVQPCSALLSFRMKKRLRYSEALRKSDETAGSDQVFAVPRQPERSRRSTPSQVTAENGEAPTTTEGSQESNQGSQGISDVGSVDSGAALSETESERCDASTVQTSRKQSVTVRRSSRKSKSVYRHSSSQESQGSRDTSGSSYVDSEALPIKVESQPCDSPRKRSVTSRSIRKSRNSCRESCIQEMERKMTVGSNVDSETVPTECVSETSDVSHNTASPRKQYVTSRSTRKSKSSCSESSSQETLGSQGSMNSGSNVNSEPAGAESVASDVSQNVDAPRKQSVTSRIPRKSRSSCPENSSQEMQGSPQSSDTNGNTNVDSETVPEVESETSETQKIDSPGKQPVTLRPSPHKSRSRCQAADSSGETDIESGNREKNESVPNKSRSEMGNDVDRRALALQDNVTTADVDTEHVSETDGGETAVVDSLETPSRRHRSVSVSPPKQTSHVVLETQGETDEAVASEDGQHDADVEASAVVCSEVAMDTDDFLSDSCGEAEEQWSVPPVSRLIGAGDRLLWMTDHSMGADKPSDVEGPMVDADNDAECHTDDGDDSGKNSTDANGVDGGDIAGGDNDSSRHHHSLYRTSSPLINTRKKELPDVRVTSPSKEMATSKSSSSDDFSHQDTSSANTRLKTMHVVPDVTHGNDGFTSEEDFEIEEPCFRVFGNNKQNFAEKDQDVDKHPQAKARKVATRSERSRIKATGGKKAKKETAILSECESGNEAAASPQLENKEGKRSKNGRKRVGSKAHDSPTETPNAPPVPHLHIQSLRRKIDLSQSAQDSPGGSTRKLSNASVDAAEKNRKKSVSVSELGEIPRDEAVKPEHTDTSESEACEDSLPCRHHKLTKKGKRSPAQGKNSDDDGEAEASGKRKKSRGKRKNVDEDSEAEDSGKRKKSHAKRKNVDEDSEAEDSGKRKKSPAQRKNVDEDSETGDSGKRKKSPAQRKNVDEDSEAEDSGKRKKSRAQRKNVDKNSEAEDSGKRKKSHAQRKNVDEDSEAEDSGKRKKSRAQRKNVDKDSEAEDSGKRKKSPAHRKNVDEDSESEASGKRKKSPAQRKNIDEDSEAEDSGKRKKSPAQRKNIDEDSEAEDSGKRKKSPAQRKNVDEDSEAEARGKRKATKQGRKRRYSQDKEKRQGGKSPKRGRILPARRLSEEALDLSLGSPQQVLSFENSNQDISLPGSSPSPIKGRSPEVLPGQTPSPPTAVRLPKTKSGVQWRKSSKPQKVSPAARKKSSVLKKSLKPKQVARLMGEKQRRSIYGLTPVVKVLSQQSVASVTPATAPKSILKKGGRYSTATPVHYFDITESAVTPCVVHSQPSKNVKIIVPDETDEEGVRRSRRTRVLPLDWFRNERILYQPRKSGGFVVAGIVSPEIPEIKQEHIKKRRKVSPKTARSHRPPPATPRNLSIHQPLPDDCDLVTSTHIPVINPTTEEEVSVECIKLKDVFNFCGPQGKTPSANDPLILCKALNQKAFSIGQLVLRPLQEKGTHYVRRDTMVFIIKQGKLAVTIHKTTSVLETDDVFFVPQGNTYNLTNLRKEDAKVWFFQLKQ